MSEILCTRGKSMPTAADLEAVDRFKQFLETAGTPPTRDGGVNAASSCQPRTPTKAPNSGPGAPAPPSLPEPS